MYAEHSKYVLEVMTSSDEDYHVIRRNFEDTMTRDTGATGAKAQHIYRVTKRDDVSNEKNVDDVCREKNVDDVSNEKNVDDVSNEKKHDDVCREKNVDDVGYEKINDDVCSEKGYNGVAKEKGYHHASKENKNDDVKAADDVCDGKTENLLLFHGTSLENSVGIIEEGFRPSEKGRFGPGVYLTASSACAMGYAITRSQDKKLLVPNSIAWGQQPPNMMHCVFVNEVLESEKLKVLEWSDPDSTKYQFAKYLEMGRMEDLEGETHDEDSEGRRIRNSPATQADDYDHYVCREDLVVPRYFIQFHQVLNNKKV